MRRSCAGRPGRHPGWCRTHVGRPRSGVTGWRSASEARFKKGQSGNPGGVPKGIKHFAVLRIARARDAPIPGDTGQR